MKDYLIDTHAHIDMLEEPTNQVLLEMHNFGIKKVIIPSVEISTMQNIVNIANQNENIYAMVGIFPSEAKTYNKDIEEKMIDFAQSKKVVAVGEIGLDYYWDKSFNAIQQDVFIKQIKLANEFFDFKVN